MSRHRKQRILLVEDEQTLSKNIRLNLELEGYEVVIAKDGIEALRLFQQEKFQLVILDVMLPGISGFEVCERIRLHNFHTPILFLTAKYTPQDRIMGLKKGADDYLTKPFNLEELLLRVKNLIRRSLPTEEKRRSVQTYRFGKNSVNLSTLRAKGVNGEFVLSQKEAMLLKLLIERKGQPISRQEILDIVWGYDVYPSTRTVDNFIMFLRKHFEQDPAHPEYILTVRGVGYMFAE